MLLLLLDLGFVENTQQAIGESGGEDSEDEWNYVKVDKKASDLLAAVEETSEVIAESPVIEKQEEEPEQEPDLDDNVSSTIFTIKNL